MKNVKEDLFYFRFPPWSLDEIMTIHVYVAKKLKVCFYPNHVLNYEKALSKKYSTSMTSCQSTYEGSRNQVYNFRRKPNFTSV